MKHLMKCLCVALILMLAAASAMAEANLSMVFQYMPSIKAVQGTNCVLVESKQDNSLGLYTTAGQVIIPCAYKNVDYLGNGFFSAYDDKDAVDGKHICVGIGCGSWYSGRTFGCRNCDRNILSGFRIPRRFPSGHHAGPIHT